MQQDPIASAIRKQRERGMNAGTQITFFFLFSLGEMALLVVMINLPISVGPIWELSWTGSEVCFLGDSRTCHVTISTLTMM